MKRRTLILKANLKGCHRILISVLKPGAFNMGFHTFQLAPPYLAGALDDGSNDSPSPGTAT